MCMALPARILSVADPQRYLVTVDCMGQTRTVSAAGLVREGGDCVQLVGTWVLLHQGFAMDRLTEEEATKTLAALNILNDRSAPLDVSDLVRHQHGPEDAG